MGRHLVTVVGIAGWLAALWLIRRLRDTTRVQRAVTVDVPLADRVREATGHVAGTVAGGMAAGALVLGLGGRFMMRVLAATSPEGAQGRITDAEEVVGEVTLGGTIGLVVFVGVFGGLLAAILYAALRRWLPERSVLAGLIVGGIGGGLLARPSGILDPDNHDFAVLEPRWLAVGLCAGLVLTFALLGAVLMDRFAPAWPRPSASFRGVAGLLPLVPLLLFPPFAAWAVVLVTIRSMRPPGSAPAPATHARWGLATVLAVAGAIGGVWMLTSATQILTA